MESHSAKPEHEYQPTIIETRFLIERLAIQLALLRDELKRNWSEFKRNPLKFLTCLIFESLAHLKKFFATPYVLRASSTAVAAVACLVVVVLLVERTVSKPDQEIENAEQAPVEIVRLDVAKPTPKDDSGFGRNGNGRVGLQSRNGEGSGPVRQAAQGGGGGGDRDPLPAQHGEVPPPSQIQAAIPIAPPINPPALPVAGIDIDPALWQDLKAPVYGDPMSKSEASKGPGTGGGIGSNEGLGIGNGRGHGFGPGEDGNTGDGTKQVGCCGPGGSIGEGYGTGGHHRLYSGNEVEQRARLLFKPEPQYTEEARRNQITGTVVLRVVFESSGEVVQIRAVRQLPFGLTERAIAAARQIKFAPAMKSGHPVSVQMQLEYNFNLY